ncbi:DUF2381 family protein [Myxococcus sp. RHSTA-1-4]|uniref:DUF2381 family protein n=1 Tax=Myxococcus sp. RHSTA-1-4 TaxID=2874601 RepID=UPI001CC0A65D|nr:DUF2381 family protein [Myxococcus sp. RHSTA-1-4]MBZ4418357.1 DUF2381 family protein [Myxococcus sp. RHSTA-1-4]
MSRAPPLPLLVLSLLLAASAAGQSAVGKRGEGARVIELGAEPARQPPELRISPTLSTVVLFDTPPTSVEVKEPRHFRRVRLAGDTLTLVPSAGLTEGARLTLTLHFQDGQMQERAVLTLLVDEDAAEREVEVRRRPRPRERDPMQLEDLHEENQQLRQALEALREENRRLRQDMGPLFSARDCSVGLGGLFTNGPLKKADLAVRPLATRNISLPEQPIEVRAAWTYRLGSQAALLLELENTSSAQSWQAGGARLESPEGANVKTLDVWMEANLGPGERGHLVLGVEPRGNELRGSFTLKLQDSEGGQTVTLRDVVFP